LEQHPFALPDPHSQTGRAAFVASLMQELYPDEIAPECLALLSRSRYERLFSDVKTDEPYAQALCVAMRHGVIRGYPDGSFRPMNTINRAEMAKVLAKSYGLATEPTDPSVPWYQPSVLALRDVGIDLDRRTLASVISSDEAKRSRWTVKCALFAMPWRYPLPKDGCRAQGPGSTCPA
jgi:hypothetical protein